MDCTPVNSIPIQTQSNEGVAQEEYPPSEASAKNVQLRYTAAQTTEAQVEDRGSCRWPVAHMPLIIMVHQSNRGIDKPSAVAVYLATFASRTSFCGINVADNERKWGLTSVTCNQVAIKRPIVTWDQLAIERRIVRDAVRDCQTLSLKRIAVSCYLAKLTLPSGPAKTQAESKKEARSSEGGKRHLPRSYEGVLSSLECREDNFPAVERYGTPLPSSARAARVQESTPKYVPHRSSQPSSRLSLCRIDGPPPVEGDVPHARGRILR